jgi:hypothetical protein
MRYYVFFIHDSSYYYKSFYSDKSRNAWLLDFMLEHTNNPTTRIHAVFDGILQSCKMYREYENEF